MPGLAGTTARRLRELGYKNSFSGSVSLAIKNEAVIANGALRGASFTDAENSANFLKRYETKHSSYPESGAAQCHDAILLLDQALREVGMDREKINSAIRRENIVGASGSFSFKNDGQNTFDLPVTVRTIE